MKLKSFKKNILESVKLYNKQEPVSTVDKDLVPTVDNIEYQNSKISDEKAKEREDKLEPNIKAADELAKKEGSLKESSDNKVPITSLNKGDKFIYNSNVCQVTATDNKRNIEAKFPDGKVRSIYAVSRVTKANPDAELKRLDVVRELDPIKEGVNKTVKFGINDKKLKEFNDYISKIGFKSKETGRKDDTTDVFASYTEVEVSGDASSSAWDKLEKDVKSHFASPVSNSKVEDYINQDDLKKAVKNAFGYEGQDAQNTINKMDDKTKQDLIKKDKEKTSLKESLEDDIKKEVAITSEWLKTWDNKYDGLYCEIRKNKVYYNSTEGLEAFTFDEFDDFFRNQVVDNIWVDDLSKENLDALHSLGLKAIDEKEVKEKEKLTEAPDRFGIETDDEIDSDIDAQIKALQAKRDELKQRALQARKEAQDKEDKEKQAADEIVKKQQELKPLADAAIEDAKKLGNDTEAINKLLFSKFVPDSDKADTVGGEILRAINRVVYRFYNDGDVFYDGYGLETAGAAATFISKKLPNTYDKFIDIASNGLEGNEYEMAINDILEDVISELLKDDVLLSTPNNEDMWDEDVDGWIDVRPLYDFQYELPRGIIDLIDAYVIDRSDIESIIEDTIRYDLNNPDEVNVTVSGRVIYFDNLTKDDYKIVEDNIEGYLEYILENYTNDDDDF